MEKKKNPVGRPKTTVKQRIENISFDYDKVFALVENGCTDVELAKYLGVSIRTIHAWKEESEEFSALLKNAKEIADYNVERSLYKRALGFTHKDLFIAQYKGMIVKEEILKYYPPSEVAMIFWLKNRQPAKWREKIEEMVNAESPKTITIRFE